MRGALAKAIRHEIYGNNSLRTPRTYQRIKGGLVNTGLRANYLRAKKVIKQLKRGGQK